MAFGEDRHCILFILGIDVAQEKWVNLTTVDRADRSNEIVQMCWNDDDHSQVRVFSVYYPATVQRIMRHLLSFCLCACVCICVYVQKLWMDSYQIF